MKKISHQPGNLLLQEKITTKVAEEITKQHLDLLKQVKKTTKNLFDLSKKPKRTTKNARGITNQHANLLK
jgi:hypothetical protein